MLLVKPLLLLLPRLYKPPRLCSWTVTTSHLPMFWFPTVSLSVFSSSLSLFLFKSAEEEEEESEGEEEPRVICHPFFFFFFFLIFIFLLHFAPLKSCLTSFGHPFTEYTDARASGEKNQKRADNRPSLKCSSGDDNSQRSSGSWQLKVNWADKRGKPGQFHKRAHHRRSQTARVCTGKPDTLLLLLLLHAQNQETLGSVCSPLLLLFSRPAVRDQWANCSFVTEGKLAHTKSFRKISFLICWAASRTPGVWGRRTQNRNYTTSQDGTHLQVSFLFSRFGRRFERGTKSRSWRWNRCERCEQWTYARTRRTRRNPLARVDRGGTRPVFLHTGRRHWSFF